MTEEFSFPVPMDLTDGELTLVPAGHFIGDASTQHAPCYRFETHHRGLNEVVARISLLVSDAPAIVNGAGHSGFGVPPRFRGNRYAARSIRLIARLARHLGMERLLFTCRADNIACRRTLEHAGAVLLNGESCEDMRHECRYRLDLAGDQQ